MKEPADEQRAFVEKAVMHLKTTLFLDAALASLDGGAIEKLLHETLRRHNLLPGQYNVLAHPRESQVLAEARRVFGPDIKVYDGRRYCALFESDEDFYAQRWLRQTQDSREMWAWLTKQPSKGAP